MSMSVKHGRAGDRSTTTSTRVERILEVSDLAALPIGRAVVFASGTRPILVQTEPWYAGPQADRIRAAMARPVPLAIKAWTGYDQQPGTPNRHPAWYAAGRGPGSRHAQGTAE
jgi:type IV secretory pathway TraG/TraD family ATPase VirD4